MSFEAPFLEVFHAAGSANRIFAVGGADAKVPDPECPMEPGSADIVLFEPTQAECRQPGWLRAALGRAVTVLAGDGFIYVSAPRALRWAIARRLQASGLEIGRPFAQLRSGEAGCLVPLRAGPLAAAMQSWSGPRRWSYVARLLADLPDSQHLLAALLPSASFLAYRPGRGPLSWLKDTLPGSEPVDALLATSWRGAEGGAVLLVFGPHGNRPLAVAKRGAARMRHVRPDEGELLEILGRDARAAGMLVPRLLGRLPSGDWLVQSFVPGVPLCRLLSGGSMDAGLAIGKVAEWLARWNARTVMRMALTRAACERHLLAPARKVCAELDNGTKYLDRLEQAAARLIWRDVAFVAAHNDLTMANVLQARDERLAVIDWKMAGMRGLPLADFWYSACDALAAAGNNADRAGAFVQCFARDGPCRGLMREREAAVRDAKFGPQPWIDLCFHACWLNHAANEQATCKPGDDRPFLRIARWIAGSEEFAL